jgi:hypothetical protein
MTLPSSIIQLAVYVYMLISVSQGNNYLGEIFLSVFLHFASQMEEHYNRNMLCVCPYLAFCGLTFTLFHAAVVTSLK